jgi:hypothetical protein
LLDGSSGNYYAKTTFIDSGTDFDFHFDCIGIVIHEYDVSATASIPGYFMTFGPQRKLNIRTYHFIPDLHVPFYPHLTLIFSSWKARFNFLMEKITGWKKIENPSRPRSVVSVEDINKRSEKYITEMKKRFLG